LLREPLLREPLLREAFGYDPGEQTAADVGIVRYVGP
jgi:hypothetical protein